VVFANLKATHLGVKANHSLQGLGIGWHAGLVPPQLLDLRRPVVLLFLSLSDLLVGFGMQYGGNCTSGHAIPDLSTLQSLRLIATVSFFAGSILNAHFPLPLLMK